MKHRLISALPPVVLCGALSTASPVTVRHVKTALPPVADIQPITRVVPYGERDVLAVRTRLRYTTLIVLPKDEKILDFICGDRDFWVIDGVANMAHVKPAKIGARTNLNLITANGTVYSFLLTEVSDERRGEPDLKIFVERREEVTRAAAQKQPPCPSPEETHRQVEQAKAEARAAKEKAEQQVHEYPIKLKAYRIPLDKAPFNITAMYHDDRFTFIQGKPQEVPVLYELKEGKPNLVNFEYRQGVFSVGKILDAGYLAIGKKRLNFKRKD